MKQSSPESTYLFVCERDIKVMLHKNLERHSHMWQFSGITSYILCCKQVINKKVQTITKYFCKSPAETKTSSSWTAEGRAPSPRGLVELEDETINETDKKRRPERQQVNCHLSQREEKQCYSDKIQEQNITRSRTRSKSNIKSNFLGQRHSPSDLAD